MTNYDYDYDAYFGGPRNHSGSMFWAFMILMIMLCIAIPAAVTGCGPHHKSAAEIRHEKQKAAEKKVFEKRKAAAEARVKKAQEKAKIAAMPSTPPGIAQMDSTHFYVKHGFEGNTRDLCRSGGHDSPAGIGNIDPAPNGSKDMIITCNNPEHEYRHETFTTTTTTPSASAAGG